MTAVIVDRCNVHVAKGEIDLASFLDNNTPFFNCDVTVVFAKRVFFPAFEHLAEMRRKKLSLVETFELPLKVMFL
jgi:hypothetical protein